MSSILPIGGKKDDPLDDKEDSEIVIATTDWVKALGFIAKKAVYENRLQLQFIDTYAPTAEYVVRILRKGFGWLEIDRGMKEVVNKKCLSMDQRGICVNEKGQIGLICKSSFRASCKAFKIKECAYFRANYIIIEKAGGIRGM